MTFFRMHASTLLALAALMVFSLFAETSALAQEPDKAQVMERARRRYIDNLVFPKNYQTGKYASTGIPRQGVRKTLLELDGPGEITRLWTTLMRETDVMNLFIYVDGSDRPVLSGLTREIAAAAQLFSTPEVPWGGFLDGYSVSLYLPIPFKKHVKVVAEYNEQIQDGPYWQIDYRLGVDAGPMVWEQRQTGEGMEFIPAENRMSEDKKLPALETLKTEVKVFHDPVDILLDGPALIREIHITSNYLDKIALRVAVDCEGGYDDPATRIDNVDFQVNAPLKYLVNDFFTAGVQLQGTTASIYFPMPVKEQALIQLQYIMDENEFGSSFPITVRIEYEKDPPELERMYYFHAAMSQQVANGYQDFEVMSVRGEGHFVGVNLFDTHHDHGGGENIFFDAGSDNAGQLHGICGEDYFHHAYMRIGVSAPYTHCPTHSARCRHHIELPIPFKDSFTFNWGCFDGTVPKAVALWYQKELASPPSKELTYKVTGPFRLEQFDRIAPDKPLPDSVTVQFTERYFPRKTWSHTAQNGFLDLCHAFRQYSCTIPPIGGHLDFNSCIMAETRVWAARDAQTKFLIGGDDHLRVYLNGQLLSEWPGNNHHDPYEQYAVDGELQAGVNTIAVLVANTMNWNWEWNGFSLVMCNDLDDGELLYMY